MDCCSKIDGFWWCHFALAFDDCVLTLAFSMWFSLVLAGFVVPDSSRSLGLLVELVVLDGSSLLGLQLELIVPGCNRTLGMQAGISDCSSPLSLQI